MEGRVLSESRFASLPWLSFLGPLVQRLKHPPDDLTRDAGGPGRKGKASRLERTGLMGAIRQEWLGSEDAGTRRPSVACLK